MQCAARCSRGCRTRDLANSAKCRAKMSCEVARIARQFSGAMAQPTTLRRHRLQAGRRPACSLFIALDPAPSDYVLKTLSRASQWPRAHRAPRSVFVFGGYRGLAPGHASCRSRCHYALKSTWNARHGTATCPSRTTEFSSVISRQGATGADMPPRSSRTAIIDRLGPTFELTGTLR